MIKRLFNFLRGKAVNIYEAARWSWGDRSWLNASFQDARFDVDAATRTEIGRKSRDFERNDAIANRLGDVFEQFVVGPNGLAVVPSSSADGWNSSASAWWSQWSRYPDLVSLQPLSILQSLWARSWFFDGEVFIYCTYSPNSRKPRIQTFEGHRVSTRPGDRQQEGITVIDGVQIDPSGRPIGYWVSNTAKGNSPLKDDDFQLLPAFNQKDGGVIHIFEPSRPGQMRGLPMLYPVINDLHDLSDLQVLQKRKAKDGAKITNVITTATGEANSGTMRRARHSILTQDAGGNATTKQPDAFYDVVLGAYELRLKKGETCEQFRADSPSVAEQAFWEYLTSRICAGVGISKLLVLPISMQGTVVRADLDISNAFFRARSQVIAVAIQNIYEWVIGWAKDFDRAMDGAPKDWYAAVIRPPRSPNVDVGRNSAAMCAELDKGVRTFQDIYAEAGMDWREQVEQRAKEAKFILDMAKKYEGVTPAMISAPAQTAAQQSKQEPDADDANGKVPIKQTQDA